MKKMNEPGRWRGSLKVIALVLLWSGMYGWIVVGISQGYEQLVMIPKARAVCEQLGYEFYGLAREGKVYVGATCSRVGSNGQLERKTVRHGYLFESRVVDGMFHSGLTIASFVLGFLIPSGVVYLLMKAIHRLAGKPST